MPKATYEDAIVVLGKQFRVNVPENLGEILKDAYELGVDLTPFFASSFSMDEDKIIHLAGKQLLGLYRIQFHNVGNDPYKRYFKTPGLPDWIKLEHYLISFFNAPNMRKEEYTKASNIFLAKKLFWLRENEKDPEIMRKASRRVTEALRILKEYRGTFTVDHMHLETQTGSYHEIRPNWI